MRIKSLFTAAALGFAALGLSACATGLNTTVSRYQAMPAPQGQSFIVVPGAGMAANGGLEFQRYAGLVAQQLQARGYVPAADEKTATMVVQLGYGVDNGQTKVVSDPQPYGYGGWDPFWGGYGWRGYGYGYRSPFYWGWDDPFWYGRGSISSYTEYHSQIDLHIRQSGTNAPLFDGRAQARSETNRLDILVPSLVEAIFTGFPGQNGETVRITVPPTPRPA
jgi:hypothetical protein